MQRTPEPELMDEQTQAAAYAGADWSEAHEKVPGHFRRLFPEFSSGHVIDIGCGTADVTIRFARVYPKVTILGVDGSETMLSFGRRAVRAAALEPRVTLEKRFLPDPAIEKRSFDALFSNSLLHHMADPVVLWRTAFRCVKPRAPALLVDLVRPPDHETAVQLVREHAESAPPVLVRDFTASLHAAYNVDEVRQQLAAAGLHQFKVEQVDSLHLVVWGRA